MKQLIKDVTPLVLLAILGATIILGCLCVGLEREAKAELKRDEFINNWSK